VDHTRISGDRLAYRFSDKNLRVYGNPYAIADAGRSLAVQEEIRVFERPHPKTGLPVRYTEMIGSRDGVRLQFEEKGK
jgi:hypothetical protein